LNVLGVPLSLFSLSPFDSPNMPSPDALDSPSTTTHSRYDNYADSGVVE